MKVIDKIKDFLTSNKASIGGEKVQNKIMNENFLIGLYEEFIMSEGFTWYEIGENYYKAQNDILGRTMYAVKDGTQTIDRSQPNNKLNHSFLKCLIDQKVNYCLGKKPLINSQNDEYLQELEQILQDNNFAYKLKIGGLKASINGVSWLFPFINEKGEFKFNIIPAGQVIPLWADDMKQELNGAIRVYKVLDMNNQAPMESTILEYWTKTGVNKYVLKGDNLTPYIANDFLQEVQGTQLGEQPHFIINQEFKSWGIVPFIPIKNNIDLYGEIRYIKNLIDNYDLTRSDLGNSLEQLRNFILVLKNAQGTEIEEVLNNLKLYGIIKTDNIDGTGSDVEMLSNPVEATASIDHSKMLKSNIIELIQGVNLNLELSIPPSGVALQLLYSGLDIKSNDFEGEIEQAFNLLQNFINIYLIEKEAIKEKGFASIKFIRNIPQNTAETIQNIRNSKGIISNKSLFKNHPFVDNVEQEQEQKDKEDKQEYNSHFDNIPLFKE